MELLDIVDKNNNLTGKVEDRDIIHKNGLWHREVACWIINENGDVLLQKRVPTKKINPNKWALTAGHIDAGEEIKDAILREIKEELGVNVKDIQEIFIESNSEQGINENQNNYFGYHFITKVNYKLSDFTIQKEEVAELKYITIEELEKIVKEQNDDYVFSKRNYMEKVLKILKEERNKICVKK